MRIQYSPFINHVVKLERVEPPNLNGQVIVAGTVDKKTATLTLELSEALRIFRELKKMDIEMVARAYGVQ